MLPVLPLFLAGGALVVGWHRQQRQAKPSLVEMLTPSTALHQPAPQGLARLYTHQPEQHLVLSAGLLGLTTLSYLGLPMLRLIALPGIFYLDGYFIRAAYTEWQTEQRVSMATGDAVLAVGLLVTRQWGANSLFTTLFFTSHTLHTKSLQQLAMDADAQVIDGVATIVHESSDAIADDETFALQPEAQAAPKAQWQKIIDQGALPLLTLSAVSMPWLGAKNALAVLLTNFGYDYRVMAPITTLSYLATARKQGIWLRDGHALEMLQQVDVLIVDRAWAEAEPIALPPTMGITLLMTTTDAADPATLIAEQQADGHVVAYLGQEPQEWANSTRPDLLIVGPDADAPAADIRLAVAQVEQLQQLLALRTSLIANRRRGLYLALAPSVINLSGIYFLRFGVIPTLLVDYGGALAGIMNALSPRLRSTGPFIVTPEKSSDS